jgi:hypothetical protein
MIILAKSHADRWEDPKLLGVIPDPSDLFCVVHFERGMGLPTSK